MFKCFTDISFNKLKEAIKYLIAKVERHDAILEKVTSKFITNIHSAQSFDQTTPVTSIPGYDATFINYLTDYPSGARYYNIYLDQNEDGTAFRFSGAARISPGTANKGNRQYAFKTALKLNQIPDKIIPIQGYQTGYYTTAGTNTLEGSVAMQKNVALVGTDGYIYIIIATDNSNTKITFSNLAANATGELQLTDNFSFV